MDANKTARKVVGQAAKPGPGSRFAANVIVWTIFLVVSLIALALAVALMYLVWANLSTLSYHAWVVFLLVMILYEVIK